MVPPETLFEDTSWDRDDQGVEAWIWRPKDENGDQSNEFFFDRAETCLFRVEEEQWKDMSPQSKTPGGEAITEDGVAEGEVKKTPYLVRGSMMLSGLGPLLWWAPEDSAAAEEAG